MNAAYEVIFPVSDLNPGLKQPAHYVIGTSRLPSFLAFGLRMGLPHAIVLRVRAQRLS